MKKYFIIRQFARFRFFVQKFGSFFTMANFISLLLIMLTGFGVVLIWYWILIIYVLVSVIGLIFVFILEKSGSWNVELLQLWKIQNAELFKEQSELNAINIELMRRKTEQELLEMKEELEHGWQ